MRSIKRTLLSIMPLLIFISPLFAQLPDPYNPDFLQFYDIITAKTAKEYNIKSLKIYNNSELYSTIIFNSEGEIIRRGVDTYFTLYDKKGWKKETHCFTGNSYYSKSTYTLTPYGDMKEIYNESSILSTNTIKKTSYTYALGLLSEIAIKKVVDMAYNKEHTNTYFNYEYDKKRKLKKMTIKSTKSSLGLGSQPATTSIDSSIYENGQLAYKYEKGKKLKFYYNDKGQVIWCMLIEKDQNSKVREIPIYFYEYHDNGLLKNIGYEWSYEYEFMDPATFMVDIPDAYNEVSFWNYSTSSDKQTHKIKNNHVTAKINVPDMELYVAQLTPQLSIPLILQPGKTVFVSTAGGGIGFAPADTMNTYALQLERARHEAYQVYGADKAPGVLANYLVNEIKKHPTHPAFLYYVDTWDIGNHKQLFLDYTERLNTLYPNNYKVKESYTVLRKNQ